MLKRLIIPFLLFPLVTFAQFTDDFEDADITDWTESTAGRWAASDILPLNGSYSLHHIFNNTIAEKDRISVSLSALDLTAQNITWRFKIKYDYNPSDGNNWSVFLAGDADANQMVPGGTVNGYALGVNFTGSDDTLRLLKVTAGSTTEIISTSLNWDTDTDPSDIVAIEIVRTTAGDWEVLYNKNGDFNSLTSIGTGTDNTYTTADYFGVYYDYTSSADRNLWIDDIYVGPEIVDVIKPRVDSLYVLSSQQLKVEYTEKIDSAIAVTKSNYNLNGGIGNPDSVVVDVLHMNAELFFNQKFTDNQQYDVLVQNIEDTEGNIIKDTTLNFTYEYLKPLSVEVISANEIEVQFSRKVDTSSAKDENNYSLNNGIGNPSIANILIDDSTKVQLQFATNFANETYYNLTVQDVADRNLDSLQNEVISFLYFVPEPYDIVINEIMADPNPEVNLPNYEYIEIHNTTGFEIDLTGWKFKVGSSERTFTDQVIDSVEYITLCSTTASEFLDDYGNVIDFSSFPTITNLGTSIVIYDENDQVIDSINFTTDWYNDPEKEDGGWSIEKIDPLNNCSGITNWKASVDGNGGTPGMENSVYASNIDNDEPVLEKIELVSNNQLKLIFNEPVLSSEDVLNYSINNGIGNPSNAVLSDQMHVDLTFDNSFIDGSDYIITINNIEDYCGNAITSVNKNFTYYAIKPFDIVINEIFADPDPAVGLPEYEYIEIYNSANYDIDLSGWKLKIGTSERDFPDSIIISSGYTILCSSTASEFLDDFGIVSVFSSFPLISNSGASIVLSDKNNFIVDSISFTTDWYNDPEKEDGGWSIEKIDPLNNCSGITNWKASVDENGGTPGQENSAYANNIDTQAPNIENIQVISNTQLNIIFSESVISSAENTSNYLIDNSIGSPTSATLTNSMEILLTFNESFIDGDSYILTVENIEDYCGNVISSVNMDFTYYDIKPFDIVINEVMADPTPVVGLPAYEYIEIYNTTGYSLDLSGMKLKIGDAMDDFPSYVLDSSGYLILCKDGEGFNFTEYGEVIEIGYSSITDGGKSILIIDRNDQVIDSINFTTDWYNDPEKEDGGWSIEKIDPLNNCSGITNWKASLDENGGTPGQENSVYASNIDNSAPKITAVEIISDNQLKIAFDEPVTESTLLEKTNYQINHSVGNPLSLVASTNFREVDLIFLNSFPQETILTLSVENLEDYCGNTSTTNTFDFIYYVVQPNDIVFNEIMANPDPAIALPEVEYIELYNTTDYDIRLKDWTLTIGSTLKYFADDTIHSGDYLILCDDDEESQLSNFGNTSIFSSLSLTDGGQTLVIRDNFNNIISQVSYSEDWYQDDYKADGGWSLEQIDPFNPCGEENNWIASESESGGTPGKQNSVFDSNPDVEAPILLRIAVVDDQNIRLFFNESIDSLSAMQTDLYSVDNGVGNPISIDLDAPDYKSLILGFSNTFKNNVIYNLELSEGIIDCAGNEISEINIAKFSIPEFPEENDIVINEILFNPLPGGYDFVEIYNRSEKTIDVKDLRIASLDIETGEYSGVEQIISDGYLIFPGDYIVLTENSEMVKAQYYTSNPDGFIDTDLPSYNDDNGIVLLMDKSVQLLDKLAYDEDMQFSLLATNEGVSLERINYDRPSDDKTNWHSASELVGFATPAYENSQFIESEDIKDEVTIEPEVFSPDNDGFEDVANIGFTFDEPGYVANIKIFDSRGRLIRYLANNQLLGIEGTITWDGLDDKSQKAPVGIYVVFIEVFDLEGNVKQYKKSVVVAAKY